MLLQHRGEGPAESAVHAGNNPAPSPSRLGAGGAGHAGLSEPKFYRNMGLLRETWEGRGGPAKPPPCAPTAVTRTAALGRETPPCALSTGRSLRWPCAPESGAGKEGRVRVCVRAHVCACVREGGNVITPFHR